MPTLTKSEAPVEGLNIKFTMPEFASGDYPRCVLRVSILEAGDDANDPDNWKEMTRSSGEVAGLELVSVETSGTVTFKVKDEDDAKGIVRVEIVCGGEVALTSTSPIEGAPPPPPGAPPPLNLPAPKPCDQPLWEQAIKSVFAPLTGVVQGVGGVMWVVGAFFGAPGKGKAVWEFAKSQYP